MLWWYTAICWYVVGTAAAATEVTAEVDATVEVDEALVDTAEVATTTEVEVALVEAADVATTTDVDVALVELGATETVVGAADETGALEDTGTADADVRTIELVEVVLEVDVYLQRWPCFEYVKEVVSGATSSEDAAPAVTVTSSVA